MNAASVRQGLTPKRRRPAHLERLSSVRLFSDCTVKELRRIDALSFEILLPAGRELVHAGETHRQCFVIASGVVAIHLNGRVVNQLGAGACFGDTRDPAPAWASVSAATSLRLYAMSAREFQALIVDVRSVGRKIVLNLARQERIIDDFIMALTEAGMSDALDAGCSIERQRQAPMWDVAGGRVDDGSFADTR